MKRLILVLSFFVASAAVAQPKTADLMSLGLNPALASKLGEEGVARSNNVAIKINNAAGTPTSVLNLDASDAAHLNGTTLSFDIAGTPVASMGTGGFAYSSTTANDSYPAAAVITPATSYPTPAAGNTLSRRYTILAAGAPTAAFVALPVATSSIGKKYTIFNQGSNPLAIAPNTGSINVDAALTPYSCATLKECECTGLSSTVWGCSSR